MNVQQHLEEQQEEMDVFDLLPDALVLEIFNRVEDARSLSACTVLCKRFGDLVTQTHNVSLEITRRNTLPEFSEEDSRDKSKAGFFGKFVLKPIHAFLHRLVSRKSKLCSRCCDDDNDDNTFRLPNDLLNNFKEIKSLSVKLPGHEGDISLENGIGPLLKWKAEFGKELESCVILGATGFHKSKLEGKDDDEIQTTSSRGNSNLNLTNKQLKKRVVWTISCLIASSARHHMLKRIINSHRMIRDVKISDGSNQGTIEMNERQVVELRKETAVDMERTKVPAVTIKMWYVPVLELPECGGVMRGATFAVIRPTTAVVDKEDDVALAIRAFEEKSMAEAVRKLVEKKKSYTLEMNSF